MWRLNALEIAKQVKTTIDLMDEGFTYDQF